MYADAAVLFCQHPSDCMPLHQEKYDSGGK